MLNSFEKCTHYQQSVRTNIELTLKSIRSSKCLNMSSCLTCRPISMVKCEAKYNKIGENVSSKRHIYDTLDKNKYCAYFFFVWQLSPAYRRQGMLD